MSRATRLASQRAGRRAETLAAWLLRLKGYRILARDWRVPQGEIDLVARRGGLVAFVEVKRRADRSHAAEAVGGRQQRRISRAALAFLQRHPALAALRQRFDVILIVPGRLPSHIKDAWVVGDGP